MTTIGILGLGEAGSAFASGLAARVREVRGFDPADVAAVPGTVMCETPADAVAGADIVLAFTHAAQAIEAAESAVGHMKTGAFYADLATGNAGLKQSLAGLAHDKGLRFVDGAIMNPVPLQGVATPVELAGDDPDQLAALLTPAGMRVTVVSTEPGVAATRKLLRSILVKGLSALIIESLRAAEKTGQAEWFRGHLSEVLTGIDDAFISRLVTGTVQHRVRRVHEMEAVVSMLEELGEPPLTADATRQVIESVELRGVPSLELRRFRWQRRVVDPDWGTGRLCDPNADLGG
jgi:3-hydroxyisobutyrate dehydrogenase-like beta-hydroxyacid dehydrogenase